MKRRSTENELIDIAAELRHETQAAYLLADGAREAWVPKSQVEDTMPSWLPQAASATLPADVNLRPVLNFSVACRWGFHT